MNCELSNIVESQRYKFNDNGSAVFTLVAGPDLEADWDFVYHIDKEEVTLTMNDTDSIWLAYRTIDSSGSVISELVKTVELTKSFTFRLDSEGRMVHDFLLRWPELYIDGESHCSEYYYVKQ